MTAGLLGTNSCDSCGVDWEIWNRSKFLVKTHTPCFVRTIPDKQTRPNERTGGATTMKVSLYTALLLLGGGSASSVVQANDEQQNDDQTLSDMADPGNADFNKGLKFPQSHPYWTDKHISERGSPPYLPPADWTYNTSAGPVEGKINVHLVPHTHDDTGWQVTVDQYFYTEVYYVLDTVIPRLAEDPNRKFIYVETAFFARWFDQQPKKKQDLTRQLVENGQLEFINGGWCMHDEASPNYVAMVDQTTRGHQFLQKHFGAAAAPKGTWQIDPFGHSNTNAWLTGAEAGMESLYWGRTDYQDFGVRKNTSRLEWVWEGSESLGSSAAIFAGELYGSGNGGYGSWFKFDGPDNQIQDDPSRHDYNVDQWIDKFVQSAQDQASHTRTEHQMWACGNDFAYQNADTWYHNLDKLIHYANLNGSVNVFYSTPSRYTEQKNKAGLTWEVRHDDIFPLADNAHNYWSGYFTSRPALKRQVRFATNTLAAARQIEIFGNVTADEVTVPTVRPSPPVGKSFTDSLEGTVGVATHHDGMSGTEREDVSDDYEQRIAESMGEVQDGLGVGLVKLIGVAGVGDAGMDQAGVAQPLAHCNCVEGGSCLNMSVCSFTSDASNEVFTVVAWNPLGQAVNSTVRLPVVGPAWEVTDADSGAALLSQATALDNRTLSLPLLYINHFGLTPAEEAAAVRERTNPATHELTFSVQLPPVGYSTITVAKSKKAGARQLAVATARGGGGGASTTHQRYNNKRTGQRGSATAAAADSSSADSSSADSSSADSVVENSMFKLTFDGASNLLKTVLNKVSGVEVDLSVSWGWYNSSVGGCTAGVAAGIDACSQQKSGAYIFRPNSSKVFYPGPEDVPVVNEVVTGDVVTEVRQTFSDWATHVIRLTEGEAYVELEWTAGPIPMDTPWLPAVAHDKPNLWGKEVVLKYSSSIKSAGKFFTDSNGRELVLRQRNARGPSYPPLAVSEPVAGNYYPVNNMIAIEDASADVALTVLSDVSQGGSSLSDGEIELMVHRRIQDDDHRGVQEPLNETMCGCGDINAPPKQMGAHGQEGDGGCVCAGLTVRGKHWLVLGTKDDVSAARRQASEKLNFPPTLAFAKGKLAPAKPSASMLTKALPPNVKLLTLTSNYADINDGALLLRLAHLYQVNEHPTLAQPVNVSLADLFAPDASSLQIKSAQEVTLGANQDMAQFQQNKLVWKTKDVHGQGRAQAFDQRVTFDPTDSSLIVTLRPMEVRTFLVKVA